MKAKKKGERYLPLRRVPLKDLIPEAAPDPYTALMTSIKAAALDVGRVGEPLLAKESVEKTLALLTPVVFADPGRRQNRYWVPSALLPLLVLLDRSGITHIEVVVRPSGQIPPDDSPADLDALALGFLAYSSNSSLLAAVLQCAADQKHPFLAPGASSETIARACGVVPKTIERNRGRVPSDMPWLAWNARSGEPTGAATEAAPIPASADSPIAEPSPRPSSRKPKGRTRAVRSKKQDLTRQPKPTQQMEIRHADPSTLPPGSQLSFGLVARD